MYTLLLLWGVACEERSLRTAKLAHKPRTSLERIRAQQHIAKQYPNPHGSWAPSVDYVDVARIKRDKAQRDAIIQRVRDEALDADADPFDPRVVPEDETPDKQKEEWASLGPVDVTNLFDPKKQEEIAAHNEKWAKLMHERDAGREGTSGRKAELAEAHARDALRAKADRVHDTLTGEVQDLDSDGERADEDLENEDLERREKAKMWTEVTDADFAKDESTLESDETKKWAKRRADDIERRSIDRGTRLPAFKAQRSAKRARSAPHHQLGTVWRKRFD